MNPIDDCRLRDDHNHTDEELRSLRMYAAERGWTDVEDFIAIHCSRERARDYYRQYGRRPHRRDYTNYTVAVDLLRLGTTDHAVIAAREEAERDAWAFFEAEERDSASRLGITLDELRQQHWGDRHGTDVEHDLRKTMAFSRAGILLPRVALTVLDKSECSSTAT